MSEFEVDTEVLQAHASRLSMVTDAVALAEDAAHAVDLHDGAFGLLCAFLPGFVNTAEVETGQAIGAARQTRIEESRIAPAFEQGGGGIQYRFFDSAGQLLKAWQLKEMGVIVPE